MSSKIRFILCLLFSLIFLFNSKAQPNNDKYLISENQLYELLLKVQSAPILNENCAINNCEAIKKYHYELYNLRQDLYIYSEYLYLSKNLVKSQWEVYLNENIRNEDLKGRMQYNLAFKDYFSDISSSLLDITSIIKSFKAGSFDTVTTSATLLNRIVSSLTELDEKIKGLDDTLKALSSLTEVSETYNSYYSKWKSFYTTFKYSIDTIKESVTIYKSIGNSEELKPDELLSERVSKGANIATLVAQLLNMYSAHERNEMKKAIAEFDKVLKANVNVQTNFYDKYAIQVGLLDQIIDIQKEISKRYYSLYGLHLKCDGKQNRKQRDTFEKNERTFSKGLEYYKDKLIETSNLLNDSWKNIETCGSIMPYQFVIKDGVGNRYDATIKITRVWDNKTLIDNKRTFYLRKSTIFNLLPDTYNIEILEGTGSNGSRVSEAIIPNIEIDASVNSRIVLQPFGRLELDVVNKKTGWDIPSYEYAIIKSINSSRVVKANGRGKVILDLPISVSLSLNIKTTSKEINETNIRVNPNHVKELQFVLDGDKVSRSKEYAFKLLDGLGKERTAYIEITRNSDGKNLYKESMNSKTKFNLASGSYNIKLNQGYTKEGIRSEKVSLPDFVVKGDEDVLELSPYGRVSLKVEDKNGKPQLYRYKFINSDKETVAYSFTSSLKEQIMDLPTNTVYDLELSYDNGYEKEVKTKISIASKQLNNLHYVYDDGKFIEDKPKTINNPPENPNTKPVVLKESPEGWVTGVLYNSNDGDCDNYKGKYMLFDILNRETPFYNLETGKYSQTVVVAPGKRLHVAIPEKRGRFNVFPIGQKNSDGKERSVSYWYYSNLINGWWYAAGCNDGTKPSSNCDDGHKVNDGKPKFCNTVNN